MSCKSVKSILLSISISKGKAKVLITRKFKQRLGDITPKEIKKEGFDTLEEFQAAWVQIHHGWNPNQPNSNSL